MDDLLWAMSTLVCEDYIDPLKVVQRGKVFIFESLQQSFKGLKGKESLKLLAASYFLKKYFLHMTCESIFIFHLHTKILALGLQLLTDLELKDSSSKYMPIIAEKHIFETSTLVQNYRLVFYLYIGLNFQLYIYIFFCLKCIVHSMLWYSDPLMGKLKKRIALLSPIPYYLNSSNSEV